jgi:hypothetical protein
MPMRWPHGDPNIVAKAVLAEPAYRQAAASSDAAPAPNLWQMAFQWFVDHVLRPLLQPLHLAFVASKGVGTAVGIVLIVGALCLFGFLIFRLAIAFAPRDALERDAGGVRALGTERTREDWLALAREAAARGDYASAIAALFAAALAALDERALVAFDPARTPGEYRRLVRRARAAASPAFDELADRFVYAAYAPNAPLRSDFEAASRAFESFEPLVAA